VRLPTTALLIRHAHTNALGQQLCGRAAGVQLSTEGRAQAKRLGAALASHALAAIYSSPLERAVETARALADHQRTDLEVCDDLTEIDFGAWTGRTFADLADDANWQAFNSCRSTAVVPGGERAVDVQTRIVSAVASLCRRHAGHTIAIVSHCDVLRFAVLHYASTPLDLYDRFVIDPASVTAVSVSPAGPRLLYVNNCSFASDS
jgi:broad specificity phosphatase PhoE